MATHLYNGCVKNLDSFPLFILGHRGQEIFVCCLLRICACLLRDIETFEKGDFCLLLVENICLFALERRDIRDIRFAFVPRREYASACFGTLRHLGHGLRKFLMLRWNEWEPGKKDGRLKIGTWDIAPEEVNGGQWRAIEQRGSSASFKYTVKQASSQYSVSHLSP